MSSTIYLAGAINGCTDEECLDWRTWVEERWSNTRNPMSRDYRGVEAKSYREIVELDKRDIRQSDVVLVNYLKPSVGTSMEVLYAWSLGKLVVLVCKEGENLSPWLTYHSTFITHSYAKALAWIDVRVDVSLREEPQSV